MRATPLLAHEVLCLRLQSFYGVYPCSPARDVVSVRQTNPRRSGCPRRHSGLRPLPKRAIGDHNLRSRTPSSSWWSFLLRKKLN